MLYVGGGIISGEASEELREFAEATQIPVTTTLMGCGAFPGNASAFAALARHARRGVRELGGERRIRAKEQADEPLVKIADGADLLLAFGVRFDDRVTGKVEKFCETGTIVHIDIDASEINKNKPANLPIVSDMKYALGRLNELVEKRPIAEEIHRVAQADRRVESQGAVRAIASPRKWSSRST